jgi:putative ABC transport system substrate-binding protein
MRRREFVKLAIGGGTVAAYGACRPLAAHAQQPPTMRRIGVLVVFAETDPVARFQISAMVQELQDLGWTEGRNVRLDYRWNAAERSQALALATELAAMSPDLIVACGGPPAAALAQTTRSVPVVFVQVIDPIALGIVASLARPGGNITGFTNFELTMAGKWLEALKDIAPRISRGVVVFDPENPASPLYLRAVENAAASFGMQLVRAGVRDAGGIERAVEAFAGQANGALIVLPNAVTQFHLQLTIALAARYRLPAIYPYRFYPASGGLMSYGVDLVDLYRRSASYIDRVLKGAKPADLPVQQPTKFELVINLKTAKALGLTIPEPFLQRADEVIE